MELFNIIGELLTDCILTILKDLVNFGEFWSLTYLQIKDIVPCDLT